MVDAVHLSLLNLLVSITNDPRGSIYQLACPPSILRSAPVIYELAGLRRNTAAPLKSSGLLSLPSMFWAGQSVLNDFGVSIFSRRVFLGSNDMFHKAGEGLGPQDMMARGLMSQEI